jgi:hypothetical protein
MKLFLTSSIGGSHKENAIRIPCAINGANNFLNFLREYWPINSKCFILSSDPGNEEVNNSYKLIFTEAFRISKLSFLNCIIIQAR